MTSLPKNQNERRLFLIRYLLKEDIHYGSVTIPETETEQKKLLRALMNVRMPGPAGQDFLQVQDDYLKQAAQEKGIVALSGLKPMPSGFYLWKGDITRLAADAIVNAANSGMTGCYVPNHACIDNCIHTYAGIRLRLSCAELMNAQGHKEPVGQAKITPGFNLPARFVIHTVGPVAGNPVSREDKEQLSSCYRSCLELADTHHLHSIAFCCISTGVFHFPNRQAAEIAVGTAKQYIAENHSKIKVLFNVFKDGDYDIYEQLLR